MTHSSPELPQQQPPDRAAILAGLAALHPVEQYGVWMELNGQLGFGPEVVNHAAAATALTQRILGQTVQPPAHYTTAPAASEALVTNPTSPGESAEAVSADSETNMPAGTAAGDEKGNSAAGSTTETGGTPEESKPEYSARTEKARNLVKQLPVWVNAVETGKKDPSVHVPNDAAVEADKITMLRASDRLRTSWPQVEWENSVVQRSSVDTMDGFLRPGLSFAPRHEAILTNTTQEALSYRPMGSRTYGEVTGRHNSSRASQRAYAVNYAVLSRPSSGGIRVPIGISFIASEKMVLALQKVQTEETPTLPRILLQDALDSMKDRALAERLRAMLPDFGEMDARGLQMRIIAHVQGEQSDTLVQPGAPPTESSPPPAQARRKPSPQPGHKGPFADGAQV